MKLIITIIHDRDKHKIMESLLNGGFRYTQMGSTGGFLREGNVTLMIGVDDEQVDPCLKVISDSCHAREQYVNVMPPDATPIGAFMSTPIKVQVGGAVTFVLNVERFERM
ncbi:MAG: cyclic-di-AMP receptor [Chthonomonadales bacterium]